MGLLALIRASTHQGGANRIGFEGTGITLHQFKLVLALALESDRCTSLKPLGAELGLTPPAVSRLVDSLVERGLVERSEDPDDRRIRNVRLTAEGNELAGNLIRHRIESVEAFAAGLDPEQRDLLAKAFKALADNPDFAEATAVNNRVVGR